MRLQLKYLMMKGIKKKHRGFASKREKADIISAKLYGIFLQPLSLISRA